jgi:hypothetical protein
MAAGTNGQLKSAVSEVSRVIPGRFCRWLAGSERDGHRSERAWALLSKASYTSSAARPTDCRGRALHWPYRTNDSFTAFSSAPPPKPCCKSPPTPRHLGARIGFLAVLHTWGQNLHHHPHLRWISCRRQFLFPVKVLSRLFRAKLVAYLKTAFRQGALGFHGELKSMGDQRNFVGWLTRVAATEGSLC